MDEVTNAYPDGWYVRIMFDELLDPEIETLTEIIDPDTGEPTDTYTGSIATTKPVTLMCESVNGGMVEVDYDGYYSPSGNSITWPLGPSLVVKPNDPTLIATSSACEITINDNVTDKAGNPVDTNQRGPYKFSVAPIEILAVSPEDDPDGESPVTGTSIWFDNIYVQFNTAIDQSSLCDEGTGMNECEFGFTPTLGYCYQGTSTTALRLDNGAKIPCHVDGDACPTAGDTCRASQPYFYDLVSSGLSEAELFFGPTPPVKTETAYTFAFTEGAKISDRCGREQTLGAPSADSGTSITFTVDKFELDGANIATGETASPVKKLKLTFTNIPKGGDNAFNTPFSAVTLDPADWTLSPMPADDDGNDLTQAEVQAVAPDYSGQVFFQGNYKADTMYTFTLKAGAVVTDAWGAQYTQDEDLVVSWKTQPIQLTSTTPADGGTVTIDPTPTTGYELLILSFNQAMEPATLDAADFTVTDSDGNAVTIDGIASDGCDVLSTHCALAIAKLDLPAGDYKLTIKAGATIDDIFGTTYTQAADKVVNFTVEAEEPTPPPAQCL